VNIRAASEADAATMAGLHAGQIADGFLPTLGQPFLTLLYRRIARWDRSFGIIAEEDRRTIGMAAATEHVGLLYRQFLLRDGWRAGFVAAPRLAASWRRALETLRYPSSGVDWPSAEVLAVAVAPGGRGRGIGRALVRTVNDELRDRQVDGARVVTSADNDVALAMYEAEGFRRESLIHVHEGRPSVVLTWR
jgi:ribosomal protein S18 acetylase RimI-like enzyme